MQFEVEQYELHVQKYRISADNEAEAIEKLFDGDGDVVNDSLEYIEVAEVYGLSADDNRDLADALLERGISITEVIPSIRSVKKIV